MRPVTIEDGRVVTHGEPASAHPEDTCQRCGGPNVVWFTPSDVWNRVMPDDGGIFCPTCFVQLATAAGLTAIWCIAPSVHPVASLERRLATVEAERAALHRAVNTVRACPCLSGASCDELDALYALVPTPGDTP